MRLKGVPVFLSSLQIPSSSKRSIEDKFKATVLPSNLEVLDKSSGLSRSNNITFIPCLANEHAKDEPTVPAPTKATSAST